MQNTIAREDKNGNEVESVIFTEYLDFSGFIIREMLETKNEAMRFQAGTYVTTPMKLPVYRGSMVSHHRDGDPIQRFHFHGNGATKEEALRNASDKLLRRDIENSKRNKKQKA
jgi:hypothetical protein